VEVGGLTPVLKQGERPLGQVGIEGYMTRRVETALEIRKMAEDGNEETDDEERLPRL
jgi:hypothetical protein